MHQNIGRYEVLGHLGRGGMADVYLARMRGPGGYLRRVAIKVIREEFATDRVHLDLFFHEARVAGRLHHPNIVQVQDVGIEDGRVFLVMDFVGGKSLDVVQRDLFRNRFQLPISSALLAIIDAAEGLEAVHRSGIVHRDVSPANLVLGIDGSVRLIDFGVSACLGQTGETLAVRKGKFAYMAPEQLRCEVDKRTDIFAAGIVLWELLTGRRLFKSTGSQSTIDRVLHMDIPPPSALRDGCSHRLDAVVRRALSRDLDARYSTARELSAALTECLLEMETAMQARTQSARLIHALTPTEEIAEIPADDRTSIIQAERPTRIGYYLGGLTILCALLGTIHP
jgi:eukaryotic-like serine/threonine-protein kinase